MSALQLLPVTVNNVSGNYTPNCILYSMFKITINGDTVIQPPTNLLGGSLFALKIFGDASHSIDFHSDYIAQGLMFSGVPPSIGDFYYGLFLWDGNNPILQGSIYKEF